MRKLLLTLVLTAMLGLSAYAQDLMSYDEVIEGSITTNRTLMASKRYLLRGFVYVRDGATLTIEAGTLIMGEKSSKGALIVERGGKIMADGTQAKPIVFTSQYAPEKRAPGDWGGVIILGKARNNVGELVIEGGVGSVHGGADDADNSGVLRYVRIEFPGVAFQPNNEINGLTLGSVGSGTVIDNVQVSYSGDDAFEFFGGAVNVRRLIALGSIDDDLDFDNGYRGMMQHLLVVRDPQYADVSGSNGIESDNNAGGTAAEPRTANTISNLTILGPVGFGQNTNPLYRRGAHIRRSSQTSIFNSVIVGYPDALLLDAANVIADAQSGALKINNSFFSGAPKTTDAAFNVGAWFATTAYKNTLLADPAGAMLASPYTFFITPRDFDARPAAGSPLVGAAAFTDARLQSNFFTQTTYAGAFAPGMAPWYLGWANFTPQYTNYMQGIPAAGEQDAELPTAVALSQNYPNPFNPSTTIDFELDRAQHVRLSVFDMMGREVMTLVDGAAPAGASRVQFDASRLASGAYVYQLRAETTTITRVMSLVK